MSSALSLAWRTLVRRPRRLALFVAGVMVAAATLIDMVMLSEGLQQSLAGILESTGYQVRATPRGLLPFESASGIPHSLALAEAFRADPRVEEAQPIWGVTVYVSSGAHAGPDRGRPLATFGLGVPAGASPILRIREGRPAQPGEVLLNPALAEALEAQTGDTIWLGLAPDPATGSTRRRRVMRVVGIAQFVFSAEGAFNLAAPLEDLWSMAGASLQPAALILVRIAGDADAYEVARDFRARTMNADIYAIPELIEAAGDRLTYFKQLSLVLGTVSLAVAFLLVATLMTLSVNERWSEIAALRAIGVTRRRMLIQVAWSGLIIVGAGTISGLGVGLIVARYLDSILTRFPGLPLEVSFFVLRPGDAGLAVALLMATGLVGGLYPAWRAANVNIAGALRESI